MKPKRLLPLILLLSGLGATLHAAEPLTAAERDALLAHLDRTSGMLLSAIEGLTPEQWNFKPAPDRWSIAENVEHLALTESMLRGMTTQAMEEAAPPERLEGARKEAMLLEMVVDRTNRIQTFEPLEPTGRWPSQSEALGAFMGERKKTKKLAREGDDLRAYVMDHPVAGTLDAYGNLMFISGHTERHVLQINEVKESEGYPR
jgi:hypothetical protein